MLYKSTLLIAASGSLNGTTYSHNRYGQYIRGRSIPVNPSSQRQQDVRAVFTSLTADWSEVLTQAQRDAWILYGNTVTTINKLGDPINLTGIAMFVRSNTVLLQAGLPQINDGPTTFSLPSVDPTVVATVSEATQLISVVFDDQLAWVGEDDAAMHILMASPKGAGVQFIDGPFRFAGQILGDGTTPPTSPTTIEVPFVATELQKSQIQARIVRADGRVSSPFRDTFEVAA